MTIGETRQEARQLLNEVGEVRRDAAAAGRAMFRLWRPRIERPVFRLGALNLAHYLCLRRHDLRPLQRRLMLMGLSSLGRSESRVLATLDTVSATLAAMTAVPVSSRPRRPSERQFFRGERLLAANSREVFGPAREGHAGRILVTLGTDAAFDSGRDRRSRRSRRRRRAHQLRA